MEAGLQWGRSPRRAPLRLRPPYSRKRVGFAGPPPLYPARKYMQSGAIMARAYYSTVFMQSADDLWSVIRDFNNYPVWVDGSGSSEIEDGKSGDAVGAVRNVLYQGKRIRQVLVALSDIERSQTYAFCGEAPMPVRDYRATLRVVPVTDGARGFVEWSATFDCPPERLGEWSLFFH